MQRRAAAIYVTLFLVVGAGAYGFMGLTEEPSVSLSGETYTDGDTLTVADRTYEVSSADGSGELAWTDPAAEFSETLEHNATVSPLSVTWDGQAARWSSTVADGAEVQSEGATYRVGVNASADPPTAMLEALDDDGENETVEVGDSLAYEGNETTVTAIDGDGLTLAWGEPYLVSVPNVSGPQRVTFVQQFEVNTRLANDPDVYDETVSIDGVESVVRRADNSTVSLDAYLPEPDTATMTEGGTLTYDGTVATIANVTADGVVLSWTEEQTNTISLSEGANVTLNGQQYFTHFPDSSSVQILPHSEYESYQHQLEEIDYYQERMLGLWGVVILSFVAAILLLGMAYMPVKG